VIEGQNGSVGVGRIVEFSSSTGHKRAERACRRGMDRAGLVPWPVGHGDHSHARVPLAATAGITGPNGEWGEGPLRNAWAFCRMISDASLDFCGALADVLVAPRIWAPNVAARAANEAASELWWLTTEAPDVDGRVRVVRLYLAYRQSSSWLAKAAAELGVTGPLDAYGREVSTLDNDAQWLGIAQAGGRPLSCEGQTLPSYTARARAFAEAADIPAAYSIHSGSAHVELWAVISAYPAMRRADGAIVRADPQLDRRVAVGAVSVCTKSAIFPAARLTEYFGWTEERALLDDLVEEVDRVLGALSALGEGSRTDTSSA